MREAAQPHEDFANAFDAAFARLQIRVEHACMGESPSGWPAQVVAAIRGTLAFAAAHPEFAYVLTSGALAHGKAGFARYDACSTTSPSACARVAPSARRESSFQRSPRRRWPAAWR